MMNDIQPRPGFIPYREWLEETNRVAEAELARFHFAPSPESIGRRARYYVVRVQEEQGAIVGVWAWDGWREAMNELLLP